MVAGFRKLIYESLTMLITDFLKINYPKTWQIIYRDLY